MATQQDNTALFTEPKAERLPTWDHQFCLFRPQEGLSMCNRSILGFCTNCQFCSSEGVDNFANSFLVILLS